MHRLTPPLLAATVLTLTLAGLTLAAHATQPVGGAAATDQSTELDLYMSSAPDGPRLRNFPTDAQRGFAIVAYKGARNERYQIRVRDLSGIEVKRKDTPVLSGTDRHSVEIVVTDFVTSYKRRIGEQTAKLQNDVSANTAHCAPGQVPPVPSPWPPPTPDPKLEDWLKQTLDTVESTRATTVELTRTLQSLAMLPDVTAIEPLHSGLIGARAKLADADRILNDVPRTVAPRAAPPNPPAGCMLIGDAMAKMGDGLNQLAGAMAVLPADTTGWHFGPTSARYQDRVFVGCLQYEVDIVEVRNNQPAANAAAATQWTVGNAGAPALVFPKPDLVDGTHAGALSLSYAGGASVMYAQSVKVGGVNHSAVVAAFVTDAQCIPVSGSTMTFAVDPAPAGSLNPTAVTVTDGVARVDLTAGDAAASGKVNGVLCVGDCATGKQVKASAGFSVIGPATRLSFKLNPPRLLNRLATREDQRVALISVFVRDAYNQPVADGTAVTVKIESGPGTLKYKKERLVNGRPSGNIETVTFGKSASLVAEQGITKIPPTDPGYKYYDLFMDPGSDPNGRLMFVVEADGARQTEAYEIVSHTAIFLPATIKKFDIRTQLTVAPSPTIRTRTPAPTETPEATPFAR